MGCLLAALGSPLRAQTAADDAVSGSAPARVESEIGADASPGPAMPIADPNGAEALAPAPPGAEAPPEDGLLAPPADPIASGLASWYGPRFHGRRTASGERYDMHDLTAAHKTLPFGTRLRVRSLLTGREVVVRINDRGPYKHRRIIDLSRAAMAALGALQLGVTKVELLRE